MAVGRVCLILPYPEANKATMHEISREQARTIAIEHLQRMTDPPGVQVSGVLAFGEHTREPFVYAAGFRPEDCWFAHVRRPARSLLAIQSSIAVLVEKSTGRVVYVGSMHDEG